MRNLKWHACAGLVLAGVVSAPALAVGNLADITIVDRDSGQTLKSYHHRGEYWVAGRPGAHYSIHVQSRDGRRLLAVMSVDGVNVLSGQTAKIDQGGYVFDPWQSYGVAGWRKSDAEIAAFTFTSIPESYAARTGRPGNVGVIGLALFPERQRPQIVQESAAADEFAAPAAAPLARAESNAGGALADSAERSKSRSLGTGHGRREYSRTWQVEFERESSRPAEIIRIRYDSRENLRAMGVIRRPAPRQPEAFPASPQLGYVPDP